MGRLHPGSRYLKSALDRFAVSKDPIDLFHVATELRAQLLDVGQRPLLLYLADELGLELVVYGPKPGLIDAFQGIVGPGNVKLFHLIEAYQSTPGEARPSRHSFKEWLRSSQAIVHGVELSPLDIVRDVTAKERAHFAPSVPPHLEDAKQYAVGGLAGYEHQIWALAHIVVDLDRQVLDGAETTGEVDSAE